MDLFARFFGRGLVDVARGLVSVASPMGRVLLGREEGDEVTVQRPAGPATYVVTGISYEK